jgi:hypothetical protein
MEDRYVLLQSILALLRGGLLRAFPAREYQLPQPIVATGYAGNTGDS